MKNTIFTGAGVAIVTPFNADGSINFDGFAENLEYQINNGTDAIIVCGTTGEASTRLLPEQEAMIQDMPLSFQKQLRILALTDFFSLPLTTTRQAKKVL